MSKTLKNKFKIGEKVSGSDLKGKVEKIEKDKKGFIYWIVGMIYPRGIFHGWFREKELRKIK